MKDEEMVEEYFEELRKKKIPFNMRNVNREIKQAYLAGLKVDRPKWHKPSEKLPEECSLVLAYAFDDTEPSLYYFVASDTWEWMPRRIASLSNDQIKCWCEIPKYEEE